MAFAPAEKYRILFWLGFSVYEDDGPAMRSLHSMDSREEYIRPVIQPILDKLEIIDNEIQGTIELASAIRDGSIEIRAWKTLEHLQVLGKIQIARLARFLKIMPCKDGNVFSSALPGPGFYSGDPSGSRVDYESGLPTSTSGGRGDW